MRRELRLSIPGELSEFASSPSLNDRRSVFVGREDRQDYLDRRSLSPRLGSIADSSNTEPHLIGTRFNMGPSNRLPAPPDIDVENRLAATTVRADRSSALLSASQSPTGDPTTRGAWPADDGHVVLPRYEAISTTYPKPHDRPLPSNDQALLHLPSDLGVSFFSQSPNDSSLARQLQSGLSLVRIDQAVLPSERHVRHLLHHFETYTSAAFPIFHIPSLHEWIDQVCIKGEPVESEVACAVLRTQIILNVTNFLVVLAVSATSLSHRSPQQYLRMEAPGK